MKNYKFGLNVYNYTPEEILDYVSENNLKHIEINISKAHSSVASFDLDRINALKEKAELNKIEFSLHLPNAINIADNIPTFRKKDIKYFKNALQLAEKLGVKHINFHMGFFFWFPIEKWKRNKALNRFVTQLQVLINICEEKKITLAIENVVPLPQGSPHYLLGDNIEDIKFVFSQIDSDYLKFCLDTGHANMAEGVTEYLNHFSDKLIAVHYHDNLGNDDSHLEIGEGNINWKNLAKSFNQIKFQGPYISECRDSKPHISAEKLSKYLNEIYITSPPKS